MRKYDPLFYYLNANGRQQITLNYDEIENIISAKLPDSAYKHRVWWENSHNKSHVQSKAWRNAGYKIDKVFLGKHVIFIKE